MKIIESANGLPGNVGILLKYQVLSHGLFYMCDMSMLIKFVTSNFTIQIQFADQNQSPLIQKDYSIYTDGMCSLMKNNLIDRKGDSTDVISYV